MRIAGYIQSLLLAVWIFSIPGSLAYHFNKNVGAVNGILVDYRVPTVSASAILLLLYSASLFLDKKRNTRSLIRVGVSALISTLLFQSALALFQVIFQKSFFGYVPFGEVAYTSAQVAKSVLFSGAIYKLPYGTTTHPNVLAGFLVVSLLLLRTQKAVRINKKLFLFLFLLVIVACLFAQSLTALTALMVGSTLPFVITNVKKKQIQLVRLAIFLIPFISFLFFLQPSLATSQNTSLSRRFQLQNIATLMTKAHPITGIGWNNFTLYEEQYGYVPGSIRFLQPVHNAFLLIIAELGILGWGGVILLALLLWKVDTEYLPLVSTFIFISSLDHYFATLTTGRMLIVLAVFLYVVRRRSQTKEV